jgi:hypothetical protein
VLIMMYLALMAGEVNSEVIDLANGGGFGDIQWIDVKDYRQAFKKN